MQKDAGAEYALFQEYGGMLMTICRRYAADMAEAEDMLQDSFVNIFRYISRYKATGSFAGWIKRITVNAAITVLKDRKIKFLTLSDVHDEISYAEANIGAGLETRELLALINTLPDGYRTIFNLYAVEGYSHEEIAKILNIRAATSRSQLSKARATLREKINSVQKIPDRHVR
jgi:RNA polymerase sigma factor (sigma-70 family)